MSYYELLVVLHIFAAVIWLGAGFLVAVLVFGAGRAGDAEREAGYTQDVVWLAPRLFIPSSLAVLAVGILLVLEGTWSFDQLWIALGLAGWLASFLLGILYFRPESDRLTELIGERGPADAEVAERLHRVKNVDRVQLTILFLVVADMVVKPTGDDAGVLIAFAAILAISTLAAILAIRQGPQRAAIAGSPAPAADR